ncbi:MAG: RNA polymerase sigma-70 factor [Bacteroidales bacterium]|nr:RNA polymerase sigma-70 factor [Bacteroidales bacterium]
MLDKKERNIVVQVSKSDLKAFEALFRKHYEMLCTYAVRFVHDSDTAEEIVQDLFYTLWEKRMQLKIETSLKSYLYTSVHNRCLKYLRHRNVESSYRDYYFKHNSETEATPEDITRTEEVHKIVSHTLDALPDKCSKIFRLNRFDGLRYHEIAEKLSISVKTVEANMGKALKLLRRNLKDYTETA